MRPGSSFYVGQVKQFPSSGALNKTSILCLLAVRADSQGVISLRLRRRKNCRPCLCSMVPMCIGHRLVGGQRICQLTALRLLNRLHRLLAVLLVADPSRYTLKAFRAGKASAMAAAGQPLPQILRAGEWRSAAVLHYVDHDLLDAAASSDGK